eukprot:3216904-Pyramimonas_sp.AAC.1
MNDVLLCAPLHITAPSALPWRPLVKVCASSGISTSSDKSSNQFSSFGVCLPLLMRSRARVNLHKDLPCNLVSQAEGMEVGKGVLQLCVSHAMRELSDDSIERLARLSSDAIACILKLSHVDSRECLVRCRIRAAFRSGSPLRAGLVRVMLTIWH